jgi:hypothetical protein
MKQSKNYLQFVSYTLLSIFFLVAIFSCSQPKSEAEAVKTKWSSSSPKINQYHVFLGEINRRGKPTGFHSQPGGHPPNTARIKRIMSGPNQSGVYTARIEIYDQSKQQWREKFSSMFPNSLTQQQVIKAISHAYKNRNRKKKQPWIGPSGLGFQIQGYIVNNGNINTAFPVFVKNR